MKKKDIPNAISMMRIILVIPIVYFLLRGQYNVSLILFLVAGLSDALDGFLAKRYQWVSRLGSFLDPLADKLLLLSCFTACVYLELMPLWLLVLVVSRDLFVAIGAFFYHYFIEGFKGEPPFSSKLNTLVQIVYLLMLIASQGLILIPLSWVDFALYAVLATTSVSGLEYVWVWGMRAWDIREKRRYDHQHK